MALTLRQLRIGKIDGKHEYLTPVTERESHIFDSFLIQDAVEPDRMHNGDILFIEGFRGTGKTSLLRWHAEQRRQDGGVTDFVLFKTDLTESQRLHISKEVGISWTDLDADKMEISQDFKGAWTWFILHKIGENIKLNSNLFSADSAEVAGKATKLLGLHDDSIFQKVIGFLPRMDGANLKLRQILVSLKPSLVVILPKWAIKARQALMQFVRKSREHLNL